MSDAEREKMMKETLTLMVRAYELANVIVMANHNGTLEIYSLACNAEANEEVKKVRKIIEGALEHEGIQDISKLN